MKFGLAHILPISLINYEDIILNAKMKRKIELYSCYPVFN